MSCDNKPSDNLTCGELEICDGENVTMFLVGNKA